MNPMLLNLMSGPAMALARYALATIGGIVVAKGYADDSTVQAVAGGVLALLSAGIGALTSTKAAKIQTTAMLPEVDAVVTKAGNAVLSHGTVPMRDLYPHAPMTDR